jgi:hypothetical protein
MMNMHNVVVVMQEENWQDDGGEHDPILVTVNDSELKVLQDAESSVVGTDLNYEIRSILERAPAPSLPCELTAVFNIWYGYGR